MTLIMIGVMLYASIWWALAYIMWSVEVPAVHAVLFGSVWPILALGAVLGAVIAAHQEGRTR